MLKELLKPEISELIKNRKWSDIKEALKFWPAPEIAELMLDVDKTDRVLLFRALPRDVSADVFAYLDHEERDIFLFDLTDQETRRLLEDLSPDDRTDLLEELPAKVTRRMLNLLNTEDLNEARQLLGYPEESIGRKMTPDFVAVRPDFTISEALSHIRKFGKDSETIYRIYVTDKQGKLLDDILLRYFILAKEDDKVSTLMDSRVTSISAFADQEEAVHLMEKYDISAIPVVDSQGILLGIVTFDDIFDISEEEATEDFQKISAINPVEQTYLSASVWKLWSKRIPWLLGLLFANFITVAVMSYYEYVIDSVAALAFFIPLLLNTAGNSGTQSSTLIVRSIATNDIESKNWWQILKKEIAVGCLLGLALAGMTYLRGFIEGSGALDIAVVVSMSMIILIVWANVVGGLLPLLLSKLKLDPAVISSPFIATLVDVSGVAIYFTIALLLLGEKISP